MTILLCCAALAPAACAERDPQPLPHDRAAFGEGRRDGPRHGPNGPGPRAMLFISPAGEPFRGQPGEPYPVQAWFQQADANRDGRLDKGEFTADAERFFHLLDLNQDGVIDGAELRRYEQVVAPEILSGRGGREVGQADEAVVLKAVYLELTQGPGGGMGGGGMGGGGGRHGGGRQGSPSSSQPPGQGGDNAMQGAAPYTFLAEPEPVAASDLSFAGRISLADFRRRAEQRFAKLDSTGRGYLMLADLPKTRVQQQAGPDGRRRRDREAGA